MCIEIPMKTNVCAFVGISFVEDAVAESLFQGTDSFKVFPYVELVRTDIDHVLDSYKG